MTKRLTQLEQLNKALRLEVKEKGLQINTLKLENDQLRIAGGDSGKLSEIQKIMGERDNYKKQCAEMEKFLADYGLKWVGNNAPVSTAQKQHQGEFNAAAVNQELSH